MSPAGAVAAGHPLVVDAAAALLGAGGNAYDAVVGAGFASAVVEPGLTSLGGGGFVLAAPAQGAPRVFDFFVDTPGRGLDPEAIKPAFEPVVVRFSGADQLFHIGMGSVAVPGCLLGYVRVHEALGRLPLEEVLAPAIHLAKDGAEVTELQSYVLSLLEPILTATPESRALFCPSGALPRAGEKLAFQELGRFLEDLPKGGLDAFYGGPLADALAEQMRRSRGLLTRADLSAYRVRERPPLEGRYRGERVLLNPPPSRAGARIASFLAHLEAKAADRGLLDDVTFSLAIAEAILEGESGPPPDVGPSFSRGTTHISVLDAEGNAASMTTSNGEGSGVIAPGAGFMLNNMLGEDDLHPEGFFAAPAGVRVSSMMCPTLVLEHCRARLVLGSGGSKRIRSAVFQVLARTLDRGEALLEAVRAPRLHFDGEVLQVEPGFPPEAIARLRERFEVREWARSDLYFGGVHAVSLDEAVGDPRRGGAAQRLL